MFPNSYFHPQPLYHVVLFGVQHFRLDIWEGSACAWPASLPTWFFGFIHAVAKVRVSSASRLIALQLLFTPHCPYPHICWLKLKLILSLVSCDKCRREHVLIDTSPAGEFYFNFNLHPVWDCWILNWLCQFTLPPMAFKASHFSTSLPVHYLLIVVF